MAGLRDIDSELKARGASVAAISVDPAPESKLMRATLKLPFALLSDEDARTIADYGVLMTREELAVPAVFVIAKDGTIAWSHIGEIVPDRPTPEAVLAAIDAITSGS